MTRGAFVTGTDTEIGKTFAASVLIAALRSRGMRVAPFKPVAAGAIERGPSWINEDTLALMSAAGLGADDAQAVTPVLLRAPMAPHIAARREGRTIDLRAIHAAYLRVAAGADFVLVEGVGGFRVPLDATRDTADLARELALPVVLVVGLRLGCLNHALLTAEAVRARGLTLAGWIANELHPTMDALEDNVGALDERLGAPLIARLPWSPDAARVDLTALLAPA
jgi:dethiobiotin synthetase